MDHSKKYDKMIQFKQFLQQLYGIDEDTSLVNIMSEFDSKLTDFVNANPGVDFDIQVNVRYRLGHMKKGDGVTKYLGGKSLESAIEEGFEVDDEATVVDVVVRPFYVTNSSKYSSRSKKEILFEQKIIIGKKVDTTPIDKAKAKYGVGENDMLLSKGQAKKSKLLKFTPLTQEASK